MKPLYPKLMAEMARVTILGMAKIIVGRVSIMFTVIRGVTATEMQIYEEESEDAENPRRFFGKGPFVSNSTELPKREQ